MTPYAEMFGHRLPDWALPIVMLSPLIVAMLAGLVIGWLWMRRP